jgi:hypothetical protein
MKKLNNIYNRVKYETLENEEWEELENDIDKYLDGDF